MAIDKPAQPHWKLPPIDPSQVYTNAGWLNINSLWSVNIQEISLKARVSTNTLYTMPLLVKKIIEKAKKSGYSYVHFGFCNIGFQQLHRKGQNVHIFSFVLDKRWATFLKALIGGVQATLAYGPVSWDLTPDFSVALDDSGLLDSLVLGIQTAGYEDFRTDSKNLGIYWSTCIKFYKTQVPASLNGKNEFSDTTTLITWSDDNTKEMAPTMIRRGDLQPPLGNRMGNNKTTFFKGSPNKQFSTDY